MIKLYLVLIKWFALITIGIFYFINIVGILY